MKMPIKILIKCFVKPFYRQHAGLFVFLFIILFGAVGRVDGAGLFDYHFSLIRGALKNSYLFLLILFLWLLYAKKCEQFILNVLRKPEYSFLQMFSLLRSKTLFIMLALVQVLLYLPIIAYAVIMGIAGIYLHTYITCGVLISYMFTICFLSARWYLYNIKNPGLPFETRIGVVNLNLRETSYWKLFIRHISRNKKLLFIGMKIFSCGILSGMLMNQTGREYELKMIILFFSLAILGHGLLIHQIRDLEETRLSFYRSIPVSLFKRYVQYAAFT